MLRRYRHRMTHQWLTRLFYGHLHPFLCQEVTPGDTWSGNIAGMVRLDPLERPTFMSLNLYLHVFYVPHRLVWPEFEDVITGADTTTAWPVESVSAGTYPTANSTVNAMWSYFGIGNPGTGSFNVNALPLRAYNLVHYEFFEDRRFAGPSYNVTNMNLKEVYNPKGADYFTSGTTDYQQGAAETVTVSANEWSIVDWRDAMHRQKYKERRSRYGDRYEDMLRGMGLRVPDSRLDRPEHIWRSKASMGISEVVATASSTSEETGEYRGHGVTFLRMRCPRRTFLEHGTLLGVIAVKTRNQLKERVDRQFRTTDKFDLYHPELANQGYETIENIETWSRHTSATGDFSYVPRYQWLRKPRDSIAGAYLSDTTLDQFHTGRVFSGVPSLNTITTQPEWVDLHQDTSNGPKMHALFVNGLNKLSLVPREPML